MINANKKKRGFIDDKLIPFFKKYGIFLVVLFLVFPYVYKYIKQGITSINNTNLQAEKAQNANENGTADPTIIKAKVNDVKKKYPQVSSKVMDALTSSAFKLANAFGTNVDDNHVILWQTLDLYNVAAWVEDEKTAMSILKQHTGTFPILEELYYKTATKSKNLRNDIMKYLSKEQYAEMKNFYKKKGYNWL